MPTEITTKFQLELAKLEQSALIELFEIDLRELVNETGDKGELYRFYAGSNELNQPIVWQGNVYQPYGVSVTGFELSTQGPSNRPTMTLVNVSGLVSGLANSFNQCLGAVVRRRKVYMQYLDAVNFMHGNPNADPYQEIVSYFVIEQLSNHKRDAVTFTLALPLEMDNALIPCRTVLITCPWVYRGSECGYTGPPVADEKGQPTNDPKKDKCGGQCSDCALRKNTRNYGGFVQVNKLG